MKNKFLTAGSSFIFMLFTAITSCVVLFSCKKEKTVAPPVFNPVGYWEGNTYLYRTVMLNKADGTSGIYFRVYNADTAAAAIKGYGTYTVTGNKLKASYKLNNVETSYIEVKTDKLDELEGKFYITATGEAVNCNLWRQ